MTTLVPNRPAPRETPAWSFPAVTRLERPGVTVVAAHLPARPLVEAVVVLGTGAAADPDGLEGLASVLGSAVLRGAAGRDEHGLAVAFERVGAVPSVATRFERTELSFDVPGGLVPAALELLVEVLRRPTLADAEIERVRDARIDSQRASRTDSTFRAGRAATRGLWAEGVRWATSSGGDLESLPRITADAVRDHHAELWVDAPVTVVLAGDLTDVVLADVAAPLEATGTEPMRASVAPTPASDTTRVQLVDVPGAVQSVLRVNAPGPAFGQATDEAALEVGTTALFASFSSRLNQRLREDLGYTYGASGGFVRLRDGGWSQAGASVRTEVTADAVRELVAVLRDAVADGLTEDEVTQARDNLVRKFPVRYDGPSVVASALVRRVHNDLGDDERDEHLAALRRVDAASATAALRDALDVDGLLVTVAGAADEVRDDLRALELGPVTDVD